jgi:hypothetical protein
MGRASWMAVRPRSTSSRSAHAGAQGSSKSPAERAEAVARPTPDLPRVNPWLKEIRPVRSNRGKRLRRSRRRSVPGTGRWCCSRRRRGCGRVSGWRSNGVTRPRAAVAYVRRSHRNGRVKYPKTEASMRAVPLQERALTALDALPRNGSPLVFPAIGGGHFDLRAPCRHLNLRSLPLHGRQPDDDRPPLRPPRPRRTRARNQPPRRN